MKFEAVIGLEVHTQLATKSKIFSGASTAYGAEPNTQACLIDLGYPGVLPVLNAEVVRMAAKFGLAAQIRGQSMCELAGQALEIAQAGLQARARPGAGGLVPDETHFLNALHEIVSANQNPADELLQRYAGEWNRDIDRIYAEYSY